MNKRGREVTEHEAALFREVVKDAKPVAHKHAPPTATPKSARPPSGEIPAVKTPPPVAPVFPQGKAPAIAGHREAYMRKGRLEPDARLDLHGYRQEAAYQTLHRFLERAGGLGNRVVLVVTGKGGVLNELLPKWLAEYEFRELVSGISAAHPKHGGAGAFYIAIKRKRAK